MTAIITVAQLARYALGDDARWRRFLYLIFLALVVWVGWWVLARGGVQVVVREASVPASAVNWRQPGLTRRGNRHLAGTGVPDGLGSAVPSSACRKAR